MKALLIVLVLMFVVAPVRADDCGQGLPCGPIPWRLPGWPPLESPTPLGVDGDPLPGVDTATPTATPTETSTPTATPTPLTDGEAIQDALATLQAAYELTAEVEYIDDSGVIDLDNLDTIPAGAGTAVGVMRGLLEIDFGPFQPWFVALIGWFSITLFFGVLKFTLPVLAALLGLVRKVVSFIFRLIPGF